MSLKSSSLPGKKQELLSKSQQSSKPPRLLALDALRGLTILLMLLVNNIVLDTATPRQLMHAPWNGGIRVADLVFPWFLFCVGVAIPFSYAAFIKKGIPSWRYDLKVIQRTVLLVMLGCLIDSSIVKHPIFTLDVLQLIGLAYMIGTMLYVLPLFRRILIAGVFLLFYWFAIKFIPVPGVGIGIFEETRNLIYHINRTYLDAVHLAGLPSVIPTGALVLIATAIGDLLKKSDAKHLWKLKWLFIIGIILVAGGMIWNQSLGYNKAVWTPSYILFTAGLATIVLSFFYLIIDFKGWSLWAYPLIVFGSNAIFAYVTPILFKIWILQRCHISVGDGKTVTVQQWFLAFFTAYIGRVNSGWLYTIIYILFWWLILWILYKKKWFIRV